MYLSLCVAGNLKCHYNINHNAAKMTYCTECSFQTSSRKVYREHKKTHEPDKPYHCTECTYTCISNGTLKTHMRIHSDERPYTCCFCPYSTKQSSNVKTHMKRKHPGKLPSRTRKQHKKSAPPPGGNGSVKGDEVQSRRLSIRPVCKKAFSCTQCDASFVREDSLRSHLRCHKTAIQTMQQSLENTALAVLQLQQQTAQAGSTTPVESHSHQQAQVADVEEPCTDQRSMESTVESAGQQVAINAVQDVLQATIDTTLTDKDTSVAVDTATPSTSDCAHTAMLSKTASNLLAFMQNNQNMAVEDNIQNLAISSRLAATSATSDTTHTPQPHTTTSQQQQQQQQQQQEQLQQQQLQQQFMYKVETTENALMSALTMQPPGQGEGGGETLPVSPQPAQLFEQPTNHNQDLSLHSLHNLLLQQAITRQLQSQQLQQPQQSQQLQQPQQLQLFTVLDAATSPVSTTATLPTVNVVQSSGAGAAVVVPPTQPLHTVIPASALSMVSGAAGTALLSSTPFQVTCSQSGAVEQLILHLPSGMPLTSSGGTRQGDTTMTVPGTTPGMSTLLYTDTMAKTAGDKGKGM